jgi:hypothetical protein
MLSHGTADEPGALPDFADPRWFPVDLDVPRRCVHLLRVAPELVERESFLDTRLPVDFATARGVPIDELDAAAPAHGRAPAWLWHTSFCGSTLMARMLHQAPWCTALREPLVLRRLADASDRGQAVGELLAPVVGLLARPWSSAGRVLIKPTHAALNIAVPLLAATPGSRALVMTSPLADFLVSHLKKSAETLAKVPVLAERALRATTLAARLPREAFAPPDALAAVAVQWAAQRELVAVLRAAAAPGQLRVVDWQQVQAAPVEAASWASRWLGLGHDGDALRRHAAEVSGRHAKATTRPFDSRTRQAEAEWLLSQHREDVARALEWAGRNLLPALAAGALDTDDMDDVDG